MAWYFRAVLAVLFATLALQVSAVVIRHFVADENKRAAGANPAGGANQPKGQNNG